MDEHTPGAVTSTLKVTLHPRDHQPIACWVIHPVRGGDLDATGTLTRTLRIPLGSGEHVSRLDPRNGTVDLTAGLVQLVDGEQVLVSTRCDDPGWCDVARRRGWAIVIIGTRPPGPEGLDGYLTDLEDKHVAVLAVAGS